MAQYPNTYTINPFIRIARLETENMRLQSEIERLTEWKDKLQDTKDELEQQLIDTGFKEYCEENKRLEKENAELQKQVDKAWLEVGKMCMEERTNTAKEILDDLRNIFIEQSSYGCDANQHVGYYDYNVKINLVIEQIEEYAKAKYNIEYRAEVE